MEEAQKEYNEALKRLRAREHISVQALKKLGKMAGYDDSRIDADLASASKADFSDLNYE